MTHAAFYCISSELYYPGAVGLVNSLRLQGHTEPIHLLDCGLAPEHRRALAAAAEVSPSPAGVPPWLAKTILPSRHPAEVMVLIDVDMIVTRSLAPLLERAAAGRIAAVKDNIDRNVPAWGDLLDLGRVRPDHPYLTSGLVVLGGEAGRRTLELWHDRQRRVDFDASYFARDDPEYAFRYLDQDVLNAVLATRVDPGAIDVISQRLAPVPPFRHLTPSPAGLDCRYPDGARPFVVHQFVRKPWLEPMYHSVYSELLRRAWLAPEAPVRIEAGAVPRRMRPGWRARLERRAVDAWDLARWYSRDVLPGRLRGIGSRVAEGDRQ